MGLSLFKKLPGDHIYLIKDSGSVAEKLAQKLSSIGIKSKVVPMSESVPDHPSHIIHLAGLGQNMNFKTSMEINSSLFYWARQCGKVFSHGSKEGLFVTVYETGGHFGIKSPVGDNIYLSGFAGLAKTLSKEWGASCVKSIDINYSELGEEKTADLIFKELLYGGGDVAVAIQSEKVRHVESFVEKTFENKILEFNSPGAIVVTGGARGITAACLKSAPFKKGTQIAILGRSVLAEEEDYLKTCETKKDLSQVLMEESQKKGHKIPPLKMKEKVEKILSIRESKSTLQSLKSKGFEVDYYTCDVTNQKNIEKSIKQIKKRFGGISAFIHGAGLLRDKYIHEKNEEDFLQVIHTKVLSMKYLLEAMSSEKLTHICCFTSIAAKEGNIGQSDYAMANEILNKICSQERLKRKEACYISALNWGPWDGGMVTDALKKHFEKQGLSTISLEEGASFFRKILSNNFSVEVIVNGESGQGQKKSLTKKEDHLLFCFHKDEYSWVNDHKIEGKPILPFIMNLEIGYRLASQYFSEGKIQNVRATKMFHLDYLSNQSEWLDLKYKLEENKITCKLINIKTNEDCFSLEIVRNQNKQKIEEIPKIEKIKKLISNSKNQSVMTSKEVYSLLFHGPSLQPIKKVNAFIEKKYVVMSYDIGQYHNLTGIHINYSFLDSTFQGLALMLKMLNRKALKGIWLPVHLESIEVYKTLIDRDNYKGYHVRELLSQNDLLIKENIYVFNDKMELVFFLKELSYFHFKREEV